MSISMWNQLDAVEKPPHYLKSGDICYYARDYTSGKGFTASEANDLISNLKKPSSTRDTPQWHYKECAAKQFARELAGLFEGASRDFYIGVIPGSKTRDHIEFDPRFDMVFEELNRLCSRARIVEPLRRTASVRSSHSSEVRLTHKEILDSLSWTDLPTPPNILILIDDVITTGKTFKACQQLATRNHTPLSVYGVFWARTIWPDDGLGDVDLSQINLRFSSRDK